jgi:ABC-type dipeptide/oligopeptide/nickel transport system permease component
MSSRLLTAGLVALALATPAFGQSACGERAEIIRVLSEKYGEAHRASGLQTASSMVEVWASAATGTWTILITQPSGVTCVAASGENWLEYEAKALANEKAS